MASKKFALTYDRGDIQSLVLKMSTNKLISDYDFFFTVKPSDSVTTDDSDALITTNPTDCSKDTTENTVTIPVANASVAVGTYKYDLQMKKVSTGDITTIMRGVYTILNDVTKRTV